MPTLIEALNLLYNRKHTREVWLEVSNFLGGFVDGDVSMAESAIEVEGAGVVPQSVILDVLDKIRREEIDPLNREVTALERSGVEMEGSDGDEAEKPKQVKRKEVKRKAPKIRTISRREDS